MTFDPTDGRCEPTTAALFDAVTWTDPDTHRAVAICHGCPLRQPCLQHGENERASGVYGGRLLNAGRIVHWQPAVTTGPVGRCPVCGRDVPRRGRTDCRHRPGVRSLCAETAAGYDRARKRDYRKAAS